MQRTQRATARAEHRGSDRQTATPTRTLSVHINSDVANRAISWCQQHGIDVSEAVSEALMLFIEQRGGPLRSR